MLTVIYFVLLQPLDDDDRGISRYLSFGDKTWLFTPIILPILISIRIIAILLLNICFISKEDYPPEYCVSASAQWKHQHFIENTRPLALFKKAGYGLETMNCTVKSFLQLRGWWPEEMIWVMADVGDMDPCYPTLLIGWKHFIFDNIGPGQGLSRQPTHEDTILAFCLSLHL